MKTRIPVRHACLRVIAFCLLSAGFLLPGLPASAADTDERPPVETRIKAAFIRHFCTYIDWPNSAFAKPDSPIVLGVMGSKAMANALRAVIGNRTAHGRSMRVRELDPGAPIDELHLLFIADSMRGRIPELAAKAAGHSVLVITESPDGLASGSAINFIIEDDRVKFDIASGVARDLGLDISAQLLTVARVVHPESE